MKCHKILISLVFIMFLVGITCVSAEDIDDISDLSSNDADDVLSVDESLDDNLAVEESDLLSDPTSATVDSWSGLSGAVNSKDIVYINSSFAPGNQIQFTRSVTVIGSSGNYIGGSDSNHIASYSNIPFYTTSAVTVTLKNIKFQNCGGNIFMQFNGNGNYIVENCTFENITANGDHQAVLYLSLGNCNITNCTFEKCTTSYGTVSNYNSGSVNAVHMTVRGTTFKDNYASVEPGAINNCGQLIVYDSVFENNEAAWWAGAIHTHYNANTTIVRSNFKNNIAGWNGGALYSYSYLTVIDSNFTGNEAHGSNGGAIAASYYMSRPYVTIENCEFDSNIASGSGGAISFGAGTISVENSRFNDNVASSGTGGAISLGTATANVNSCNFTCNHASARGGAIYASGAGTLNVNYSNFVNNTGSEGNDIAYYYTAKKTNKAFLNYDYNEFWGVNNASGSIYAYNTQYLNHNPGNNNVFHDISEYVTPGEENTTNDTNGSSGTIIVPDSFNGVQLWNASLSGALGGTPLVSGERIYVPNGQAIYCLNITNGDLLWNVSSEWGYFHELGLHNGVLVAPCAWDKFYMFDAVTGSEIQPASNIYQASSYYAPAIDGNTIYVSSEYPYGVNNNSWIAVIKYENNVYSYVGSILEINNASSALISQPIVRNGYLWVNTINGLMCVDLSTNTSSIVLTNTVGKPVVGGDIIYVLTSDNHICGVDSSGSVVKNITVNESDVVGTTLAINSANTILYTVSANGFIYRVTISSGNIVRSIQVNPVSSALTIGSDGYLYIGDDAGIFWVINIFKDGTWKNEVIWAFNASSPIHGAPIIDEGIVYIGTDDTIYAVSESSSSLYSLNQNGVYARNGEISLKNQLLGMGSNEILKENLVPGKDKYTTYPKENTVFYLNEGVYTIKSFRIGGEVLYDEDYEEIGVDNKNNITVRPNGNDVVIIKFVKQSAATETVRFWRGENFIMENLKFTSDVPLSSDNLMGSYNCKNVMINNCTFENIDNKGIIFKIFDGTSNITFKNCKFINCTCNSLISTANNNCNDINLLNCIVENFTGKKSDSSSFIFNGGSNIYLENNTFNNNNSIAISGGKIVSEVSFNVLTNQVTLNTQSDIFIELLDDNNNHIHSSAFKFIVDDGEPVAPTSFDKTTGLYKLTYTPTKTGKIPVSIQCSNVVLDEVTPVDILVVESPELTINATDSIIYGATAVYVNATLKEDINGENVTFTLLKGSTVIDSVNATVTNGFANATFNQKLSYGSHTLSVSYSGNNNYGAASDSKTFTVNQATPDIKVEVNPVIGVGNPVVVTITLPEDITGEFEIIGIARNTSGHAVNAKQNIQINSTVLTIVFNETIPVDEYWIWYTYPGDANYKKVTISNIKDQHEGAAEFKVVKNNPTLNITHSTPVLNENVTITVTMNKDINEDVNVTINNLDPVVKQVVNGSLVFNITNAPYGPQNITVSFAGNDKYNATKNNTYFFVGKFDVNLKITADAITYGEPLVVMVNANKDFNGEVFVKIGNTTKPVDVVEGKGNATFTNLTAGEYFINATFTEDETFYADSANTTATVKGVEVPADKAISTNVPANTKSPTFSIKLEKDATGTSTVNIDNGKIVKTAELKDGAASITVADLAAGDHTISVSYSGDGKYAPITQNTTLNIKEPVKPTTKVTKKATKIVAKKKTFKAKVKVKKYTITLKSGKTLLKKVKVTLKVKGKTYKATTNNKGKATFKIKNLKKKGTYKAVIKFKGNKNYKASSKKVKIKVKK